MATIPAFVDTNVLLYAASTHPAEADKHNEARSVLTAGNCGFSVQVAQEFFVNATGNLKPPLSSGDALKFLQEILPGEIIGLDFVWFQEAVRLHDRFQISF